MSSWLHRIFQANGGLVMTIDIRGIWESDPQGRASYDEMVQSEVCLESVGVVLGMISAWLKRSQQKHLVVAISCSLAPCV